MSKDGSMYEGRLIDTVGAHTVSYNSVSIGVRFEGNFEKETMCDVQKSAGNELIYYLKNLYPGAEVKKHSDFNATACPGKNFPFDEIASDVAELTEASEIIAELSKRNIITNVGLWNVKYATDTNAYWLARKALQYDKKSPGQSSGA